MALPKRQQKDQEERKIFEGVFDSLAIKDLFKMKAKRVFDIYKGMWKEGKESRIFIVKRNKDNKYGVIKIYKVEASNFKNMQKYIVGDVRFQHVKDNRRSVVYVWCRKEYHNLLLAREAGINAPEPWYHIHNIIAMELIGKEKPAPQLKEVRLTRKGAEKVLKYILEDIKKLSTKAKLVHGDISEYNILLPNKSAPTIIDFGQAVLTSHPLSKEFLKRDITNIINYFHRTYSILKEPEEAIKGTYEEITKERWQV